MAKAKTKEYEIAFGGVTVQVIQKKMKTMRLSVHPPDGRVRLAAPLHVPEAELRRWVQTRLGWISAHREEILGRANTALREYQTGERHALWGREYPLRVVPAAGRGASVAIEGDEIVLWISRDADAHAREEALREWYRKELKEVLPELVERWSAVAGVPLPQWGVKAMRTRWGTCNPVAGRIWLNLHLARRPPKQLEYVVAHELVHLLERGHGPAFQAQMDRVYPGWRAVRKALQAHRPEENG